MSNSKKDRKKSKFQEELDKSIKKHDDKSMSEEKRKEKRYKKLEEIFNELGNKENRYLFYCPDFKDACTINKTIYEYVNILTTLGYTALVVHETKGYKPTFLPESLTKNVKVLYLSQKSKGEIVPELKFKPTDTIIIPDAFWPVMTGFYDTKSVHKVVLCFGYNGLAAATAGADWGLLGFNDVICLSESLKDDYSKLWPNLNYHVASYSIDRNLFTEEKSVNKQPVIAISARDRDDAQTLINVFYAKYPFMDMFRFVVLKGMETDEYVEALQKSVVSVLIEPKAGYPPLPLESIACNTPVIMVPSRGTGHLLNNNNISWVENDSFMIAEILFEYCIAFLDDQIPSNLSKDILDKFDSKIAVDNLHEVVKQLQGVKVQQFTAIKDAVDKGKLDEAFENVEEVEIKTEVVNE